MKVCLPPIPEQTAADCHSPPNTNIYKLLYRRLLEHSWSTGSGALAALLRGVLAQLVTELSGPKKDVALAAVFDCQWLFIQSADALCEALDIEPDTDNLRLRVLRSHFEQQLDQVRRYCANTNPDSMSYLDRMNLKDLLHQLLQTVRTINEVEASGTLSDAA